MTQAALAAAIGVHKSHISSMERSVRPIGKAMAKKLGHPLSNDWGAPLIEDYLAVARRWGCSGGLDPDGRLVRRNTPTSQN
jgi:transcriptional regulator with XRE-family HTH domain